MVATRVRVVCATIVALMLVASPATAEPRQDAKEALGAGDGSTAAQIIRDEQFFDQPDVLADIIYGGGVIAVGAGLGDEFSDAVPVAFVNGDVTFQTAQEAFLAAALLVAQNAPTDDQLLMELGPGGLAILKTEAAYLGTPISPFPEDEPTVDPNPAPAPTDTSTPPATPPAGDGDPGSEVRADGAATTADTLPVTGPAGPLAATGPLLLLGAGLAGSRRST